MRRHISVVVGLFLALVTACAEGATVELGVYFGNLHSHTSYSDGSGKPSDAYKHARDTAKLDFLAVTEHNHIAAESGAKADRKDGILIAKDHSLYEGPQSSALIPAAKKYTKDGTFVAIYGQEFSSISKGNHVNVFEVDKVIDVPNGSFDQLLQWCQTHPDSTGNPAIIQFNHPTENDDKDPDRKLEYGADDFGTRAQWVQKMGAQAHLVEILNGPAMEKTSGNRPEKVFEKDYLRYLRLGFRVAPTGDQDNHYKTWGTVTDARTAVVAPDLTKADILAGLRARHVYATEDKNLKVIVMVNHHLCGDVLTPPAVGSHLDIAYNIRDENEPGAEYHIDVFQGTVGGPDATVVNTVSSDGNTALDEWRAIDDVKFTGGDQFIFFRVRQEAAEPEDHTDRVWTAPVWFGTEAIPAVAGPAPGPATPDEDISKFVGSKRSAIYHVSDSCKAAKMIKPENRLTGSAAMQGRTRHVGCPQN